MDKIVDEYLKSNNVGVLAIAQTDGTLHSASLHYAHAAEPLKFYFATEKESYKCRPLVSGEDSNASLVIGFSEQEFKTLQASGLAKIVSAPEAWAIYIAKFTDRKALQDDKDMALIEFTPHWWRYRDMKVKPMLEFSSNS